MQIHMAEEQPIPNLAEQSADAPKLKLTDDQIRSALRQDPLVARKHSLWAWTWGTFFGIGLMGKGGGTVASAVTCLIWWGLAAYVLPSPWIWPMTVILAIITTLRGIGWSSVVARELGKEDPSEVVIDEVAGQLIALIWAPLNWKYVFAAFILFRAFDILKPPPIRQLEDLPSGLGIMMDDVGAGLFALVILLGAHHYQWI